MRSETETRRLALSFGGPCNASQAGRERSKIAPAASRRAVKPLSSRVLRRRTCPVRFSRLSPPARRGAHRHAGGVLPGLQHADPGRDRTVSAAHPRRPGHELRAGRDALRRRDLHLRPRPDPGRLPRRPLRAEARLLRRDPGLDAPLDQLRNARILSRGAREPGRIGSVPRDDLRSGPDAGRILVSRRPQGDRHGRIRHRRGLGKHPAVARRAVPGEPLRLASSLHRVRRPGSLLRVRISLPAARRSR